MRMNDELMELLPTAAFALLIIILNLFKKKKTGNRKNKARPGMPRGNSRGYGNSGSSGSSTLPESFRGSDTFTVAERARTRKDLSGKIHGREHTHDRLDFDCYVPESGAEHYRKQLESFLRAGVIDRAEYQTILRKYTEQGIM